MDIGARIKKLRKDRGITQKQLADMCGTYDSAIRKYESGKTIPRIETIKKIADALCVPVEMLMGLVPGSRIIGNTITFPISEEMADLIGFQKDAKDGIYTGSIPPHIAKLLFLESLEKDDNLKEDDYLFSPLRRSEKRGVKIPVLGRVAAGIPITAVEDILDYEEIEESLAKTGEFYGLQIKGDSMEPRISEGDVVIVRQQNDVESGDVAIVLVNGDDATCKRVVKHEHGLTLISFNPMHPPKFYTEQEVEQLPVQIIGRVMELRAKF